MDSIRFVLANKFRVTLVHQGESLWRISKRFLGDPLRWPELYAWNVPAIGKNPHLIHPLMQLEFPPDTLNWKIELENIEEGGWVVEFVHIETRYRFFVGVGFDEDQIKFSLNAFDTEQTHRWRDDDGFIFGEWINDNFFIDRDRPGMTHRYVDPDEFYTTNYLIAPVPPGLPRYIPIDRF